MSEKFAQIALIGVPNAGKSTLLNQLVGVKVAITSHKVQTTRNRIVGLLHEGDTQIALLDTPGIFQPKKRLEQAMVNAAWQGLRQSDHACLLIDVSHIHDDDRNIIKKMQEYHITNAILVLNKIDKIAKEKLLEISQELFACGCFSHVVMISALKGHGVAELKDLLYQQAKPSPFHYEADDVTDMPDRLLASEITREKILQYLHQELPYEIHVDTIDFKEDDEKIEIRQEIISTKENHKPIIIGKNGATLKKIGKSARQELSKIFGKPTHIYTHVKIRKNWQDTREYYRNWQLD
jgi:GTP-binding protein Era